MAFVDLFTSLRCDTTWLFACAEWVSSSFGTRFAHTGSCEQTRDAHVWVTAVWEWSQNELDGLSEGGSLHSAVSHFFIWLTDLWCWSYLRPVCEGPPDLILDCLPLMGGQKSTLNMSFIKQWGHKEDGESVGKSILEQVGSDSVIFPSHTRPNSFSHSCCDHPETLCQS